MADSTREPAMDAKSLYREEIYTDRKMGTLRVMLPVTASGDPDKARPTLYLGEAQLMTNMGPLPISFEIEADIARRRGRGLRRGREGRRRAGAARAAGHAAAGVVGARDSAGGHGERDHRRRPRRPRPRRRQDPAAVDRVADRNAYCIDARQLTAAWRGAAVQSRNLYGASCHACDPSPRSTASSSSRSPPANRRACRSRPASARRRSCRRRRPSLIPTVDIAPGQGLARGRDAAAPPEACGSPRSRPGSRSSALGLRAAQRRRAGRRDATRRRGRERRARASRAGS